MVDVVDDDRPTDVLGAARDGLPQRVHVPERRGHDHVLRQRPSDRDQDLAPIVAGAKVLKFAFAANLGIMSTVMKTGTEIA